MLLLFVVVFARTVHAAGAEDGPTGLSCAVEHVSKALPVYLNPNFGAKASQKITCTTGIKQLNIQTDSNFERFSLAGPENKLHTSPPPTVSFFLSFTPS